MCQAWQEGRPHLVNGKCTLRVHGNKSVAALVVGCELPVLFTDDCALAFRAHYDAVLWMGRHVTGGSNPAGNSFSCVNSGMERDGTSSTALDILVGRRYLGVLKVGLGHAIAAIAGGLEGCDVDHIGEIRTAEARRATGNHLMLSQGGARQVHQPGAKGPPWCPSRYQPTGFEPYGGMHEQGRW